MLNNLVFMQWICLEFFGSLLFCHWKPNLMLFNICMGLKIFLLFVMSKSASLAGSAEWGCFFWVNFVIIYTHKHVWTGQCFFNKLKWSILFQISDARVTITEPNPGATETVIIISGTPEQTHAAQSLIQAFVLSETQSSWTSGKGYCLLFSHPIKHISYNLQAMNASFISFLYMIPLNIHI